MKTRLFYLCFVFNLINSALYCQEVKFEPPKVTESDDDPIIITLNFGLDFINKCASILNSDTLTTLPLFLETICIDDRPLLWPNSHSPISIRKSIIDKVTKINVLNRIVFSRNDVYKEKCEAAISYDVPFCNYSYYDLCLYRIEELKQEREYSEK